jgi:hypothetical protein
MTKLFLDDVRNPSQCLSYCYKWYGLDNLRYKKEDWEIVRNYDQFVAWITENGLPDLVSFDHDLAEAHYHESMYKGGKVYMKYLETVSEKTGAHCAQWLIDYCIDNKKLLPEFMVHSMNPVGRENIISLLTNFKQHYG